MVAGFAGTGEIGGTLRFRRGVIGRLAAMSAVLNIMMLGGSFFMLLVYDEVLPSRSVPTLIGLIAMIVVVYGFQSGLDLIRSRAMVAFGAGIEQRLGPRVFDVVTRYELRMGPLREGMQPVRDLDQVRTFFSGSGPLAALDLPWVLLYLGVLFMFHWILGVVATVGAIVLVILTVFTDRMTKGPIGDATAAASGRFALADAGRRNAEVLQALGMSARARASWMDASDRHLQASERLSKVSGTMSSLSRTFRMLLQSLMLATGAALVINDKASGGVIIASSILSARALAPVEQAIANWKGLIGARQAWERLDRLLGLIPAYGTVMPLPAPKSKVTVEALSVGPPGSQRVSVGDISFELSSGEVLGVIGPSGSGKTSLVRGLVGIWQPLRGKVRLDGAALDQWLPEDIGPHLGFMPQDVELFDGTVAQNIGRFEPEATADDIIAAARAADVHDLITRLPQGYDTVLGVMGGNLSAGQRQRVALARALYGEPFLVVLDEPNSNLDADGEAALIRAIARAKQRGAIVVLVAHRPSVLVEATHLLHIVEGRARLFGPRDEVLAKLNMRPPTLPERPARINVVNEVKA